MPFDQHPQTVVEQLQLEVLDGGVLEFGGHDVFLMEHFVLQKHGLSEFSVFAHQLLDHALATGYLGSQTAKLLRQELHRLAED